MTTETLGGLASGTRVAVDRLEETHLGGATIN